MIILLILYFLFLIIYLAFNIYGILRIWAMRIKGDRTELMIIIYLFIISTIILISLLLILGLDWSTDFTWLKMGG